MTSAFDTLIGIVIIGTLIIVIGSKIYNHEKEHLEPILNKIKGWFHKDSQEGDTLGPEDDFELAYRGQQI